MSLVLSNILSKAIGSHLPQSHQNELEQNPNLMNTLNDWHDTYVDQRNQLVQKFPFTNSTDGYFEQYFIGHWQSGLKYPGFESESGSVKLHYAQQTFKLHQNLTNVELLALEQDLYPQAEWELERVREGDSIGIDSLRTICQLYIELDDDKYIDNQLIFDLTFSVSADKKHPFFTEESRANSSLHMSNQNAMISTMYGKYGIIEKKYPFCESEVDFTVTQVDENPNEESFFTYMWAGGSDEKLNSLQKSYTIDFIVKPSSTCGLPSEISGQVFSRHTMQSTFNMFRYTLMYLTLSIFSIVISRNEIRRFDHLALNYDMEPQQINPYPLIIGRAMNLAVLFFNLLWISRLPGLLVYPSMFLLVLPFIADSCQSSYMKEVMSYAMPTQRHARNVNNLMWITCLIYLLFLPTILANDNIMLVVLGFLWLPQILTNIRYRPANRKFSYSRGYLVIQTLQWLMLAYEARAGGIFFDESSEVSIMRLRPHPNTILKLISCLFIQIFILKLQDAASMQGNNLIEQVRRLPRWVPGKRKLLKYLRQRRRNMQGLFYVYYRPFNKSNEEEQHPPNYSSLPQNTTLDESSSNQHTDRQDSQNGQCLVTKDTECVICLCALRYSPEDTQARENPSFTADDVQDLEGATDSERDSASSKQEQQGYFETPCKHVYHACCLRRWMQTQPVCPTCRQTLPKIHQQDGPGYMDDDDLD